VVKPKLIKVRLVNDGADAETPWAHDIGPAPGPKGSRRVRLVNVPFMHAKPTWGDVIAVAPVDGVLTWDREGIAWEQIGTRIVEDGGRWAMIIDHDARAFDALVAACNAHDIVCEGARAGRAYLAVPAQLTDVSVMTTLRAAKLPGALVQTHPKPVAPKKARKRLPRKKAR